MIVQEELKKVILEEALASGLDREDAEQLTELTFERWTELIRDGVLVGLLSNHYETQRLQRDPQAKEKLGVVPQEIASALVPRNGFRFARGGGRHFDAQPGIHPTNVIVPGEVESREEMARLVG